MFHTRPCTSFENSWTPQFCLFSYTWHYCILDSVYFFVYFYIKILIELGIKGAESVVSASKQWVMLNVKLGWLDRCTCAVFPCGSLSLAGGAARYSGLLLLASHRCIFFLNSFSNKALGLWKLSPAFTLQAAALAQGPPNSELHQGFAAATSLPWPSHKSADFIAVNYPSLSSSQADEATLFTLCYGVSDIYMLW